MDVVNKWLKDHEKFIIVKGVSYKNGRFKEITPKLYCKDGFNMSVQASRIHYSSPKEDDPGEGGYESVEVGYPSKIEKLLMPYIESPEKPTDTVYPYVPVETVVKVIEKHGGIDKKLSEKMARERRKKEETCTHKRGPYGEED